MADIVKSRNAGQNGSIVLAPLYDAPIEATWDAIPTYDIVNEHKRAPIGGAQSILSRLDVGTELSDISGLTVTMVTNISDKIFKDIVKIVGMSATAFVVEIDGTEYSVRKSIVRFIKDANYTM